MRCFFSLILAAVICSCSPVCHDYSVVGPCEFVTDSYKIRQGKFSILEMEGACIDELSIDSMIEYEDVIANGDILNIVIYHPSRKDLMDKILMINEKGGGFPVYEQRITLPDIASVEVAGLTIVEAQDVLKEKYREHIQDVEVFVSYKDRLRKKVELTGMVSTPTIPVDGNIRLYEVIAKAKIPPDANLFRSYVSRNGEPLPIDLHRLINQGDMEQNIVMKGGDKIFIANPSDSTVMVMGEVGLPTSVKLPYGYISLPEAIVAARGIPYTGDRRHIQIIRGGLQCPKIYVLSWDHIVHLPNESLLLIPGDTVYVSEKPITKWNRFISQVLPSCQGIQAAHTTYKIFADN